MTTAMAMTATAMKITAVITNPVQFTPGVDAVMIPYTIVEPPIPNLQNTNTTQAALAPDDGNWGDEECRAAVAADLQATYGAAGYAVEVLLAPEWAERQQADAKAQAAEREAAQAAAVAAAKL